jgi:hypothetical protein
VSAVNNAGEGEMSGKTDGLTFDDGGITTKVTFSEPEMMDSFTIKLKWHAIAGVTDYKITYQNAMDVPITVAVKGKTTATRKWLLMMQSIRQHIRKNLLFIL